MSLHSDQQMGCNNLNAFKTSHTIHSISHIYIYMIYDIRVSEYALSELIVETLFLFINRINLDYF